MMNTYKELIDNFIAGTKEIISDNLTGIYLHGSAVMGCFQPKKSDLDLLIVIKDETQIKILYSIRKHIRADISTEFNQETSFGDPYKI